MALAKPFLGWWWVRCPPAAGTVLSLALKLVDQLWFKDGTARLQVVSHDPVGPFRSP